MDPKKLYLYAVSEATKVIEQVEPEQMELATPDTEWSVHDLLQHITYELAWTADIVAGKTIAEVGDKYDGELLNGDPVDVWKDYEVATRVTVESCNVDDMAHLSYADKSVGEYLIEAGNDQLVHAWDLGEAIGIPVHFDEHIAEELYQHALARKVELLGSGLFAEPVEVPELATTQRKLLGILGRSERWRS